MTTLRSAGGRHYDVSKDQAASFEIPPEKTEDMLGKAGKMLAPQGGPEGSPGPQRMGPGGPGGMPGPSPVVVQIFLGAMPGPPTDRLMPAATSAERNNDVEPYWGFRWPNCHGPLRWTNWTNW